jgi:DNA-binding transcriptional LysR family regulator
MTTNNFYYKNNRLQQLRGFYNVVKFGSVTKAAEKMGLVQSAISLQIKNLQDDLGVKLLEMKGSKIQLTNIGQSFYAKAFPIVENTDNLFKEFWNGYNKELETHVRVAMNHVASACILPLYISDFLTKFPNAKLKLSSIPKQEAIERLLKDELDMAVYPCSIYEKFPPELDMIAFRDFNMCILVPKDHELAEIEDSKITLSKLLKYKLLYEDEKLMTSSKLVNIFKENNIESAIEFENVNLEIVNRFCAAGVGIAGFDEIYCKSLNLESMIIKSIAHFLPKMRYYIFLKKNSKIKKNVAYLSEIIKVKRH